MFVSPPGQRSGRRGIRTHNPEEGCPASDGVARQFACLPSPVESPGVAPGPPPRQGGVVPSDHRPVSRQWTTGESHPDLLRARQASCCWTSSPSPPPRKARSGLEPEPPPYHGGVPPVTPADRGNRVAPAGLEPAPSCV